MKFILNAVDDSKMKGIVSRLRHRQGFNIRKDRVKYGHYYIEIDTLESLLKLYNSEGSLIIDDDYARCVIKGDWDNPPMMKITVYNDYRE